MVMKNMLLTLAATAALLVGGMTFTDTAEAQRRGWGRAGVYYGGAYRPYYGYRGYRAYPRYYGGYRGYYGYPGYYGRGYYPGYSDPGVRLSTPVGGFYFY